MSADATADASALIDEAAETDHAAFVARLRGLPGTEFDARDTQQELSTGLASGFFNNVILVRWPDAGAERLAALLGKARERAAPWRFYVTAATSPVGIEAMLESVGLVPGTPGQSMLLDDLGAIDVPDVHGLLIERVTDADGLERWLEVRRETNDWSADTVDAWRQANTHMGFGDTSPVRSWYASIGGETIAIVQLHIGEFRPDGTRDAGIYNVETVPRARRQGIATVMTAHAIAAATEFGVARVVLSASEAGRPVYARLSFRSGGSFTFWFDPDLGR